MRKQYGSEYLPYASAGIGDCLPPEFAIDFLAWQLCGNEEHRDASAYFDLIENRDLYELTLAYAMKRTELYLIIMRPKE